MAVRQFCEHRSSLAAACEKAAPYRQTADYLAGYAEALADRQAEPRGAAED
ncbi:hypothetical protein [[Mycobacterium] fortunisiensis]|uniref:hypothetical protein n=1 Tax=[Mycobacterium] fortunisiensis TaxID=2600579 RepID=UPI001C256101|nr:hypothetical protein [[Mycobacterium] fortunisiensis]